MTRNSTIEPVADRLLIFISSLEHEVLLGVAPAPCADHPDVQQARYGDGALARHSRKEAGRLDTKALLKMLKTSSDDDDEDNAGVARQARPLYAAYGTATLFVPFYSLLRSFAFRGISI